MILAIDFSAVSGNTRAFIVAGGIVLVATVAGFVIERVLISGLRRLAKSTSFQFDDIVMTSLRGVARWGFFLLGVFAALPALPIPVSFSDEITLAGRLVILVFAFIILGRFASGIAAHYAHRLFPSSVSLTQIIVNAIVMTIGVLIIFQTIGIKITPILGALGVGGIAVALALQDTLANFFAGMQIMASRQIRIEDYIRLDTNQEGFVRDIGWRTTTVQMLNNNMVIVPNTKLAQAIVINYSLGEADFSVWLTVGVSYSSNLEHVESVTIDVARQVVRRVEGADKDFEPLVRFHTFGDSSIQFNVVVRCTAFGPHNLVMSELLKAIHKRYAEEKIEIPFPIRTVLMRGESRAD